MGYGYLGQVLVVDLAKRTASVRSVCEEISRRYWGGSGLGVALLREMGDPAADAADPRNPLIFFPGRSLGWNMSLNRRGCIRTPQKRTFT